MMAWMKRERQTRTPVHNLSSEATERETGRALAYRMLASLQMLSQLILWLVWQGYDETMQAAWQAVVLLGVPLGGLWALWAIGTRNGSAALDADKRGAAGSARASRAGSAVLLLLLPCLMLDAYLLVNASYALMRDMIPSFAEWVRIATVIAFPFLTALEGKKNGIAYGAYALRFVLLAAYLLSTALSFTDASVDRLWPLLGGGFDKTALTALGGVGAVWGVALLFTGPAQARTEQAGAEQNTHKKQRALLWLWALLPLALCLCWALWLGMTRPWRAGDGLESGRKLIALSRYSANNLLCEASALFWMMTLPLALSGTAMTGARLLRPVRPKLPRWLCYFVTLLPAAVGLCLSPGELMDAARLALPYRAALSLVAAGLTMLLTRRGKRA